MNQFLDSIGYGEWILHALVLLPLAAVIPVLLGDERSAKRTALAITVLELILSLGLWWDLDAGQGGMQMVSSAPWIPRWGINYRVGIDGISLFMVLLTTVMMPLSVLASWTSITRRERAFYALMLTLLTGLVGVFIALDLFVFYVFFEAMLIPMYFIIGIWGGANRLYAAIKFFIYTMAGSLPMLVAVEAPTAGSVLLASVMLKIGTYGFLRFAVPFFPEVALSPAVSTLVVVLAVIGIIYGALVAMVQPDIKKLVAYSSVSHLGFVMLGIWGVTVISVQGALMVMISHGISTGALFLLIGMIYERRHTRMIEDYGGIARVVPVFSLVLTVVALSSIGLPGLNGFVGEFLVLLGSFSAFPWATGIATTGVIFAAAYLLWALQRMIFNRLDNPENEQLTDLTRRELAVLLPLVAGIIWLGLYPAPVLRRMEPASQRFVEVVQPGALASEAGGAPVVKQG